VALRTAILAFAALAALDLRRDAKAASSTMARAGCVRRSTCWSLRWFWRSIPYGSLTSPFETL